MGFLNIPTDDDLLKQLKEGNSPFRYIPDDIGEIVYCNSTNPKGAPDRLPCGQGRKLEQR